MCGGGGGGKGCRVLEWETRHLQIYLVYNSDLEIMQIFYLIKKNLIKMGEGRKMAANGKEDYKIVCE